MGVLSGVLVLMLVAGFLSSSQIQTASAITCAPKHKYDGVCDNTNTDITCKITSTPNHAVIHIGSARHAVVEFKVQASDPLDGIKKVLLHVTHDNTSTKVAKLAGDGLYHATWTSLAKGDHIVTAGCNDKSANTAHDVIIITIKK